MKYDGYMVKFKQKYDSTWLSTENLGKMHLKIKKKL